MSGGEMRKWRVRIMIKGSMGRRIGMHEERAFTEKDAVYAALMEERDRIVQWAAEEPVGLDGVRVVCLDCEEVKERD